MLRMRRDFAGSDVTGLKLGNGTSGVFALLLAILFGTALPPRANALDDADLKEGLRLFSQKGNCQVCHGWAGDGRKMDSQMPDGANLRESKLDLDGLIATIKCGRPGRDMPAFDKFAYSDGRCFGMKQADLASRGLTLPDPPDTLQPREIALLADFLLARIVGQGPMDHAKCVAFFGSDADACAEFPK
jgi:mono/diheme cytochrome c family protein